MEAKAILRHCRIAPRKARIVVDLIRGRNVEEAISLLEFTEKRAAAIVRKVLNSAVANAEDVGDVDIDKLYVKKATVDQGPTLRRFRPRAQGRAFRINRKTSHIVLVVAER
ncbi:MAG: 50S ribosomal protein L22 [Polyangia bacterium]|jgi:large subunit ribosomal protein L22|nr:50S ribosomal protein L22 [Polyangia bacterium]